MSTSVSTTAVNKYYGRSEVEASHVEYEWTIKDFRLFPQKNGEYILSPRFSAKENDRVKWGLMFYPRGDKKEDSDYVSLFLSLHSYDPAKPEVQMQGELSIFKSESIHCERSITYTYKEKMGWGFHALMERSTLLGSCGSDDSFTVRCKVDFLQRIITKSVNPVSFDLSKGQMNEHYSQLFEDSRFCDVTIIVREDKFTAHKLVLAARSTVFAAMLEHKDMEENRNNEVKIEDLESAAVKGMLEFFYTDQVTDLETLASQLLRASDKYDLHRLRTMCEKVLYETLTIDNAAEILVLSDLHHSDNLKEYVMGFIDYHLLSVMESESYKRLLQEYPILVNDLMYAGAVRRKSKA